MAKSFVKAQGQTHAKNLISNGPVRDGKIALVLFAYHHGTENVASQRFRGLLRYLPSQRHDVYIYSGPWSRPHDNSKEEVTSVGAPLLGNATLLGRFAVLKAMLRLRRFAREPVDGETWIAIVVRLARVRIRKELESGNQVVLLATYSPIDTLIAARLLATSEGVPLIQDFRDGLVHENLGRKGPCFQLIRRILEDWLVLPAAIITTVSRPLVEYFAASYPGIPVDLLYNGYYSAGPSGSLALPAPKLRSDSESLAIGHFGRISASDGGAKLSYRYLLRYLGYDGVPVKLAFYGTLTEWETVELSRTNLQFQHFGYIPRQEAILRMRNMDALLLVTSDRESVASGKFFEYLFSGRRIILATLRRNEAVRLLEEIGDDDIIIDFSKPQTIPGLTELVAHMRRPFKRNLARIRRFKKSIQVVELERILQTAAAQSCRKHE